MCFTTSESILMNSSGVSLKRGDCGLKVNNICVVGTSWIISISQCT